MSNETNEKNKTHLQAQPIWCRNKIIMMSM